MVLGDCKGYWGLLEDFEKVSGVLGGIDSSLWVTWVLGDCEGYFGGL